VHRLRPTLVSGCFVSRRMGGRRDSNVCDKAVARRVRDIGNATVDIALVLRGDFALPSNLVGHVLKGSLPQGSRALSLCVRFELVG
jgi:hypothetical protein